LYCAIERGFCRKQHAALTIDFVHAIVLFNQEEFFKGNRMLKQDALIINKLGLHARASAKLTQLASRFPCEVWLTRNSRRINAKSIMGVMMLAAAKGSTITIETDGEQEQDAMNAILALINDYFGEGE
jgi:phosphocarrier protein HPr